MENRCNRLDALRTARSGAASSCTCGDSRQRELDAGEQPHRVVTDISVSATWATSRGTVCVRTRLRHTIAGRKPGAIWSDTPFWLIRFAQTLVGHKLPVSGPRPFGDRAMAAPALIAERSLQSKSSCRYRGSLVVTD